MVIIDPNAVTYIEATEQYTLNIACVSLNPLAVKDLQPGTIQCSRNAAPVDNREISFAHPLAN